MKIRCSGCFWEYTVLGAGGRCPHCGAYNKASKADRLWENAEKPLAKTKKATPKGGASSWESQRTMSRRPAEPLAGRRDPPAAASRSASSPQNPVSQWDAQEAMRHPAPDPLRPVPSEIKNRNFNHRVQKPQRDLKSYRVLIGLVVVAVLAIVLMVFLMRSQGGRSPGWDTANAAAGFRPESETVPEDWAGPTGSLPEDLKKWEEEMKALEQEAGGPTEGESGSVPSVPEGTGALAESLDRISASTILSMTDIAYDMEPTEGDGIRLKPLYGGKLDSCLQKGALPEGMSCVAIGMSIDLLDPEGLPDRFFTPLLGVGETQYPPVELASNGTEEGQFISPEQLTEAGAIVYMVYLIPSDASQFRFYWQNRDESVVSVWVLHA